MLKLSFGSYLRRILGWSNPPLKSWLQRKIRISERKNALIRNNFIKSGLCSAEQLAKVFAPIGFNIGALTVPEIAISITAELVAVRRMEMTHTPWADMGN